MSECIVCSGKGAIIRNQYNMENIKKCDIIRCQNCGLEYVHPMLTEEELAEYFGKYEDFRADDEILRRNSLRKIKNLSKHGLTKKSRLLDFGCGKNTFVEVGKSPNWIGYDKYASFQSDITKYFIYNYLPESLKDWDFITMWGVLAHLPDPKETLNDLVSFLKKGGKLALTDIVTDSQIPFQYRYEHVTYWCKESIETLFSLIELKICEYKPYKMMQRTDIYLKSVLRTVPDEFKSKIYHDLPEYIEVPTNEVFVVGVKQ